MRGIKLIIGSVALSFAISSAAASSLHKAVTEPIPIRELQGFDHYDQSVKTVLLYAYALSRQHLTYLYGSADPNNKGMDCSGTINYLLKQMNISDPPRQARTLYLWAQAKGKMYHVHSSNFNSRDFAKLRPGDLIFWSGTYATHDYPPITHVTIYLGKNKKNQPLMFGSSDGRRYQDKYMWGVSVYDFILPEPGSSIKLAGYSCIPDVTCG